MLHLVEQNQLDKIENKYKICGNNIDLKILGFVQLELTHTNVYGC